MSAVERPEVLVIGSATCLSSKEVAHELRRRGAAFHYADFQDFESEGVEVFFQADDAGERLVFHYAAEERMVSTEALRSVYFREIVPKHGLWHLDPLRLRRSDAPGVERHHWQQVLQLASSVLEYLGERCFCLLPKALTGQASNKLRQLALARDLGFRIPETYVGSDLAEMRDFVRRHGAVISKPFHPQSLFHDGYNYRTYTSLFTLADLEPFAANRYPVILQEAITDRIDVRVGIVGRRVLATEIDLAASAAAGQILDFRHSLTVDLWSGAEAARYRAHTLPDEVRERCLAFVRSLSLQYSMMDLLLTADGEYVFLENNSKGMHGEVEQGGHQVIAAIADLLLDPDHLKLL